jgi:hypothetical protein
MKNMATYEYDISQPLEHSKRQYSRDCFTRTTVSHSFVLTEVSLMDSTLSESYPMQTIQESLIYNKENESKALDEWVYDWLLHNSLFTLLTNVHSNTLRLFPVEMEQHWIVAYVKHKEG